MKINFRTAKLKSGKIGAFRKRTGSLVAKFASQEAADFWVARSVEEDHEFRTRFVREYLAERAARPAPVVVPSAQLSLFA